MAVATGTYSPSVDKIIRRALRQCLAVESGETPGAQEMADAYDALNAMVAEWQATGIHVWTETEGILFLQPGQIQYSLGQSAASILAGDFNSDFNYDFNSQFGGTAGQDQACFDGNWQQTTTTAAVAAGVAVLPIVAGTFVTGDFIGVQLQTNGLYWTTVSTSDVGTVTLSNVLPSSILNGAMVVSYPQKYQLPRPTRIIDARRYNLQSLIETPLIRMARLDYRDMPNKTTSGTISSFFYDPQVGTAALPGIGYNWLWPAPPDSLSAMKFTFHRPLGDFQNASDTPDFPQEWTNALTWNLAEELAPEYGVGEFRMKTIALKAAKSFDIVSGWDKEPESVFFGVNFEQSSR